MASFIPGIKQQELDRLEGDFGKSLTAMTDALCLVMDATTLANEEKTCVLGRFMSKDLYVQQRLLAIAALAHHANGMHDARLAELAMTRLGASEMSLIAFAADRHGSNNLCHAELCKRGRAIFLIGCFSHTLDKVGKKFNMPELKKFMETVRSLLSLSNVAKRLFRAEDSQGKDLAGYAAIRWWNDWVSAYIISKILL